MKRFTIVFSIFLCIFFNVIVAKPTYAVSKTFKEGIYTPADLNILSSKTYNIQNVSKTNPIRVIIFNENYIIMQNLKIDPESPIIDMVPIKDNYTFVIAGDGEAGIIPD